MANPWYSRYPGDYGRDTAHLSLIEHGAYCMLLDHYYSAGRPLPADRGAAYRICRAFSKDEQRAVDSVVQQFFELREDGWHNKRADAELQKQAAFHEKLSAAGRKRWQQPGSMPGSSQAGSQAIASTATATATATEPQSQPQKKQAAVAADAALPVAFTSPLFVVNTSQDQKLSDTYPWVEREVEYRKMALWCEANRPDRKVRNTLAFAMNWFNKIPCPSNGANHGTGKRSRADNARTTLTAYTREPKPN